MECINKIKEEKSAYKSLNYYYTRQNTPAKIEIAIRMTTKTIIIHALNGAEVRANTSLQSESFNCRWESLRQHYLLYMRVRDSIE